jgi:hypothetical protein
MDRPLSLQGAVLSDGALDVQSTDATARLAVSRSRNRSRITIRAVDAGGAADRAVLRLDRGHLVELRTFAGNVLVSTSRFSWARAPVVRIPTTTEVGTDVTC